MSTSTEIWTELEEHYGSTRIANNCGSEEIKEVAYQAFSSAISKENRFLISQAKGELSKFRLNLNISSGARNRLNQIWDFYAWRK